MNCIAVSVERGCHVQRWSAEYLTLMAVYGHDDIRKKRQEEVDGLP